MTLDIRYVAGLFDGEGWITINKWPHPNGRYVRYQLFIGIGMTYYPIIAALKSQFGGLLHRADSANKKDAKNRIGYQWRLSSRNAAKFLENMLPYLEVKKDEAKLAIAFQKHVTKHSSDFKYRPHLRPELYAFRESMIGQIRKLKKREWDIPNNSDPDLTAS